MKIRLKPTSLTIQEEEYPSLEVDLAQFPECAGMDPIEAAEYLSEQVVLNTSEKGQFQGEEGPLRALYERIQGQTTTRKETTSKAIEFTLEEEEV
jgi:hypothetical protein